MHVGILTSVLEESRRGELGCSHVARRLCGVLGIDSWLGYRVTDS